MMRIDDKYTKLESIFWLQWPLACRSIMPQITWLHRHSAWWSCSRLALNGFSGHSNMDRIWTPFCDEDSKVTVIFLTPSYLSVVCYKAMHALYNLEWQLINEISTNVHPENPAELHSKFLVSPSMALYPILQEYKYLSLGSSANSGIGGSRWGEIETEQIHRFRCSPNRYDRILFRCGIISG